MQYVTRLTRTQGIMGNPGPVPRVTVTLGMPVVPTASLQKCVKTSPSLSSRLAVPGLSAIARTSLKHFKACCEPDHMAEVRS